MNNQIKRMLMSSALLFSSVGLTACSKPQPKACYRLTELGAEMANDAALLKTEKKKETLRTYKSWGVFPKRLDGEIVNLDENVPETAEKYSANQVIDTTKGDLQLVIPYSETQKASRGLDMLFLIGNHTGNVLPKKSAFNEGSTDAILYPSTTLSDAELTNYDLDATWTSDESKHIDSTLFNTEQETVVNYKLVDNSGVLSTENKTVETNLHFSVNLKNDSVPEGSLEVHKDVPYTKSTEEIIERLKGDILNSYTSINPRAELSVRFVKDENGTEKTLSDWETEKVNNIAKAKQDKAFSDWPFLYIVSDSDGNSTTVQTGYFKLSDNVAPVIKENGEVVSELKLGDGNGIQIVSNKDIFINGAKALAKDKGYTFEDEIVGEIEPRFSINNKGQLTYSYMDASGNGAEGVDESLYIKDFEYDPAVGRYWGGKVDTGISDFQYIIFNECVSVTSAKYWDYDYFENELACKERKVFVLEPFTTNKGTYFEDILTPKRASGFGFSISKTAGDIIVINAPVLFCDVTCTLVNGLTTNIGDYPSYPLNVFICSGADFEGLFNNLCVLVGSKKCYVNFYMEGPEREFSYKGRGSYWWGSESDKSYVHIYWNQTLSNFKQKFSID